MEQYWGSMEQYAHISWPWPIAVYLFLAGLSAGAIIFSILLKRRADKQNIDYDGFTKAGALIAPITIILGLLLLIIDLEKPLSFWRMIVHLNFKSVMTIGVLLLTVYTILSLIYTVVVFRKELSRAGLTAGIMKAIRPIVNFFVKSRNGFEGLLLVIGTGVGLYTGFLISAIVGKPVFNTPLLPLLFLLSGLSAGIAGMVILGITAFKSSVSKENLYYLLNTDIKVIPFEIFVLFLMFVGMYFAGGNAAEVAGLALTSGVWAITFWVGVVGIGLILPIIISVLFLHGEKVKPLPVMLNCAAALVGVLALRFFIVYAGQIYY